MATYGAVDTLLIDIDAKLPGHVDEDDGAVTLLDVEVNATQQRRLASWLRLAGFPSTKTLEDFDFTAQPSLDRRLVDELATLRFIEEKANVLAIGPPGVGRRCSRSRSA